MSSPQEPAGPTADAGIEPGHRARALAASLLGELTGQRRTPAPSGPEASPTGREQDDELRTPPQTPVDVPSLAPGPVPGLDPARLTRSQPAEVRGEAPVAPPETDRSAVPPAPASPDAQPAAQPASPPDSAVSAPAAAARTAPTPSVPTAPTAALVTQHSLTPVPGAGEQPSAAGQEVRPAAFTYLAVAQHHTVPARATANGALDQAGQRISSRVDRTLARRAAQVTMEAASLLDACDVLDGRAQAVDSTWTGEHHSATEVREFDGAWGAFYDAQGALAQHVTT